MNEVEENGFVGGESSKGEEAYIHQVDIYLFVCKHEYIKK